MSNENFVLGGCGPLNPVGVPPTSTFTTLFLLWPFWNEPSPTAVNPVPYSIGQVPQIPLVVFLISTRRSPYA